MTDAFEFWKRVDSLRQDKSLAEIADYIGIKHQSLRNLRSENRYPKTEETMRIAQYLNTTVDYLMSGKESGAKSVAATAIRQEIDSELDKNPDLEKYVLAYLKSIKDMK